MACQHCGALADTDRIMCPSCRRRMRPSEQTASILPTALQETLVVDAPVPTREATDPVRVQWEPPPSSFRADLKASLHALRSAPLLVLTSVVVAALPAVLTTTSKHHRTSGWAVIVGLPLELFGIGFSGTQRLWLIHSWRQSRIAAGEVWSLTWRYTGRFMRLGLMVFWPFVPVAIVAALIGRTWLFIVVLTIYGFFLDALLTFVVPDLTFVTNSATNAWKGGRELLSATWPNSRWYVLAPGLAALAAGNSIGRLHTHPWENAIAASLGTLIALAMKGAILAYYLRLRPRAPQGNY